MRRAADLADGDRMARPIGKGFEATIPSAIGDEHRLPLKPRALEASRGQHFQRALTGERVEARSQAGRADIDRAGDRCDGDRLGGIEDHVLDRQPFGGEIAFFLRDEDRA